MQFLLIARMFGFSKSSKSKQSHNKKKKSHRHKSSKSHREPYIKREHIKSESGLCAMDHKTLKLLTEMESAGETNGRTHIVNDHICQVSNTFTKQGRYTQIICTTFTPYDKTKYSKPHSHHHNNNNTNTNQNHTHINHSFNHTNHNIISEEDDITPPLPTTDTPTAENNNNSNIPFTETHENTEHKIDIITPDLSNHNLSSIDKHKDSHYSDHQSFKLDIFDSKLHDENDDENIIQTTNIKNPLKLKEINSGSNSFLENSKSSLSNLVQIDCNNVTNITAAIENQLGRHTTNVHVTNNGMLTNSSNCTTTTTSTSLDQYNEDKNNGLILKDFVEGMNQERRPSNLFRKNSANGWKLDDLEDQENSIKKKINEMQMIINTKSIGIDHGKNNSKYNIGLNPDSLSPLEQDFHYS